VSGAAAVVAAYSVVLGLFGAWVAIMARRAGRRARELSRLRER